MFDLFENYKVYLLKELEVSSSTYEAYIRDVGNFINYVDVYVSHNIYDVTTDNLTEFSKFLEKNGKTISTINRNIASIRNFYRFLKRSGMEISNPAIGFKYAKTVRNSPVILSDKQVDKLIASPDCNTPKGCRDKAMLELLYATGIRVSELIALNYDDINLKSGYLCLKDGKNPRTIPIYKAAKVALKDYMLRVYPYYSNDKNESLFINMNGTRLTRQGFWKIIKFYSKDIGLKEEITPHTLRHSFAAHLIENGADVEDVKEILGHSDLASTQIYAQIVNNRFKNVYNRCHPRAKSV